MKKHPWQNIVAVYSKQSLLTHPLNSFNVYCSHHNGAIFPLNRDEVDRFGLVFLKKQQSFRF